MIGSLCSSTAAKKVDDAKRGGMVNLDADVMVQTSTIVVASSKVSTTMITHVDVSTIREQEGAGQGHPKLDCQYVAVDTVQNKYLRGIIGDGRVWLNSKPSCGIPMASSNVEQHKNIKSGHNLRSSKKCCIVIWYEDLSVL